MDHSSQRKLYRSRHDRKLAGVCGGLAEYFQLDATLVRLVTVLGAFIYPPAIVMVYILAIWIIPKELEVPREENG